MDPNYVQEVKNLLKNLTSDKLEDVEIIFDSKPNNLERGVMSEMPFVIIKNKNTGDEQHLVVKTNFHIGSDFSKNLLHYLHKNEVMFYSKVWSSYQEFQKSYQRAKIVDTLPKYYSSSVEFAKEKLVLENLTVKKYEGVPRCVPVDLKINEVLFKTFGQFHGLSFAFKQHHPEKHLELASYLRNNWKLLGDSGYFVERFDSLLMRIKEIFNENEDDIIYKKIQKRIEYGERILNDFGQYNGPNSVLVHGDCHNCNMLFKFNEKREVEDIKLLDFQISYVGTPVFDLSYLLYTSGDKESLNNLEGLLKIYHRSLSETVRQFGCDPEKMYPFATLKHEWKEYNAFGFIIGLIMWVSKSTVSAERIKFTKRMDTNNGAEAKDQGLTSHFDKQMFKERALDLIKHMEENGFL